MYTWFLKMSFKDSFIDAFGSAYSSPVSLTSIYLGTSYLQKMKRRKGRVLPMNCMISTISILSLISLDRL